MNAQSALRAYARGASFRSARDREADTFHQLAGALRSARDADARMQIGVLTDTQRVWRLVIAASSDPNNRLPSALRANLISVGRAVLRSAASQKPDFDFLIAVTQNVAAGLSG